MVTAVEKALKEGRSVETEQWLDENAVPWEFISGPISLDRFDIPRSLSNQARIHKTSEHTLDTYIDNRRRGVRFPAVVAATASLDALFVMIDGNHRLVSAQKVEVPLEGVYWVQLPANDSRVIALTQQANTRHGLPTNVEERVYAASLRIEQGSTEPDAAAAVNVPLKDLRRHLARVRANKRADDVGIPRREWDDLNAGIRARLVTIWSEEGFRAAAALARKAKLSWDEVNAMVNEINQIHSSPKQVAVVRRLTEAWKDRISQVAAGTHGKNTRAQTPRQRWAVMVSSVLSLPDVRPDAYTQNECEEQAARLREAARKLDAQADELSPLPPLPANKLESTSTSNTNSNTPALVG